MTTGKQLFSTLAEGKLTVEIAETEFPDPTGNQVLVAMEAAPINPSDLAILTSAADLKNADYGSGRFIDEQAAQRLLAEQSTGGGGVSLNSPAPIEAYGGPGLRIRACRRGQCHQGAGTFQQH